MNIFVLDEDPIVCAKYHCDKHVVKMILEHVQMLSTVARAYGQDAGYKVTHAKHPCTLWLHESHENWLWLTYLTHALHDEWRYRWNKPTAVHKSIEVMNKLRLPSDLPLVKRTPFAQAMPKELRGVDAVEAYRVYYRKYKSDLHKWTKRDKPEWL